MREAVVFPVPPTQGGGAGQDLECCACGQRYAVKRTALQLRGGHRLFGTLCPECILQGPGGAARRLKDRLRDRMEEESDARKGRSRKRIDPYCVLIALKIVVLEGAASFPLAARQAAVRELREKR